MDLNYLRSLIKEVRGALIKESGFSRIRQIMLGQVPTVDQVGILTAQNPGGQPASAAENNALMQKLKAALGDLETGYTDIGGSFGSPENSVFIMNISRDDTAALGLMFGQEAVIWGQKLRNDEQNPFFRFEYIEGYDTIQTRDVSLGGSEVQSLEDYYSQKGDRKFLIPFFDDKYEGARLASGGRRISFADDELPDEGDARTLAESITQRNKLLFEQGRTKKSKWHHRNVMREEMKSLEKLLSK